MNRLVVQVPATLGDVEFHLHFRRKGSAAGHEDLTQAALARSGNTERGRALFFDAAKSQCVKCHRVEGRGESIGPDLTAVGSRFPRIHLIESILQPGRTVAPGYQSVVVALKDGRVFSGVRVLETDEALASETSRAEALAGEVGH